MLCTHCRWTAIKKNSSALKIPSIFRKFKTANKATDGKLKWEHNIHFYVLFYEEYETRSFKMIHRGAWPCVNCFVRSLIFAACFRFWVTSSSLSSSTVVFRWPTSVCRAARSSCRPCTSCCLSPSSFFSCRDCAIDRVEIKLAGKKLRSSKVFLQWFVKLKIIYSFFTIFTFVFSQHKPALRALWPCHPAACWSPPALLGAQWSCRWPDPAATAENCSLTAAGRSCCSASLWSRAAPLPAPCCLGHQLGGQLSDWSGHPLPPEEMWSPVCHCIQEKVWYVVILFKNINLLKNWDRRCQLDAAYYSFYIVIDMDIWVMF